jgi:hypothetical protein
MAFDVTGNPLTVHAADVATVAVVLWQGNIHIWEIAFSEYAANTDNATLLDLNGKVVWYGHAPLTGDLETVRSGHVGNINNGLKVAIGGITSGTMRIYFK